MPYNADHMIHVDVQYYDQAQHDLISSQGFAAQVAAVVSSGIHITEQELVAHSLFVEQKDLRGWRTFKELVAKLPFRLQQFRDYFDTSGGTIRSHFSGSHFADSGMTERVGVGSSLSVANRIFGLNEADWARIPASSQHKTLDFLIASTGSSFVELEAKGSVVNSVAVKGNSVSHHKSDIIAKKKHAVAASTVGTAPNARLGVIAAIPTSAQERAVCWLVDPPSDLTGDPRKYKLLARMNYYLRILRPLTTSTLLTALADRIEALGAISDYEALDGVPLQSANQTRFQRHPRLFRNKTVVRLGTATSHEDAFGRAIPLRDARIAYVGIDSDVYRMLASQKFSEVLSYECPYATNDVETRTFDAVLPVGRILAGEGPANRWTRVRVSGVVQALRSGFVVGTATRIDNK